MIANRHVARLCQTCTAPMARQDDACWSCGTAWATEEEPPTRLRVLTGGAADPTRDKPVYAAAAAAVALPVPR